MVSSCSTAGGGAIGGIQTRIRFAVYRSPGTQNFTNGFVKVYRGPGAIGHRRIWGVAINWRFSPISDLMDLTPRGFGFGYSRENLSRNRNRGSTSLALSLIPHRTTKGTPFPIAPNSPIRGG